MTGPATSFPNCQASCLCYLNNGIVFVGSSFGDTQLLQLATAPNEQGEYLQELERWPNLGPVVDFTVVDQERRGQGQVITCSGAYADGSLRVVRNGVGLSEHARVEMPGVK